MVAGNNVALTSGDFAKIDDGWQVSKTINSSAIQDLAANIPWYFETKDRAGNVRRASGSISGRSGGPGAPSTAATMLVDNKFDGFLNLNTFAESDIRVTRDDANGNPVVSNAQPITRFASNGGEFTFTNEYTATQTPMTYSLMMLWMTLLPAAFSARLTPATALPMFRLRRARRAIPAMN